MPSLRAGNAPVYEGQLDIFKGRGAFQQVVALKDEPEVVAAEQGPLVATHRADLDAFEEIFSFGRRVETTENVHAG